MLTNEKPDLSAVASAKAEASKINGAKSQGPTTPEGKARSSQNALKHGLRSSVVVLANESHERYDALLARYKDICRPAGQIEYDLLVHMVDAQWRLRRVKAMSTRILDLEMFQLYGDIDDAFQPMNTQARQTDGVMSLALENPVALIYLDRQEERLTRLYTRALTSLVKLQTLRLGAKPTFNLDETNEPETDPNNCESEEMFAYFMQYLVKTPHRKPPINHPSCPPPPFSTDPPPPSEPAA